MPRILVLSLAAAAIPLPGCSDTLLRESVLANTETLIGLSVSQDPRTNLYQGRVGYARHELFLVPTAKRVGANSESSGDPTSTPEVLGEIMADGTLPAAAGQLGGRVGVYQRLAVGKQAVQSSAAVALLARDAQTAGAISASQSDADLDVLASLSQGRVFPIEGAPRPLTWPAAADAWSRTLGFESYDDLYANGAPTDRQALAKRWRAELSRSQPAPPPAPTTAKPASKPVTQPMKNEGAAQ
jgi:hypothetical protein